MSCFNMNEIACSDEFSRLILDYYCPRQKQKQRERERKHEDNIAACMVVLKCRRTNNKIV